MQTAFSAVTTGNIPADAKVVFAYANPPFAQIEAVRARCPGARVVPIATHAGYMAEMFDFERGAIPPGDAGATIRLQLQRGLRHPICYFSLADRWTVVDSLRAKKVDRVDVRLIVAHYTDRPDLPDWADGVQWTANAYHKSLNAYELRDDFFRWDSAKQPAVRRTF